MTRDMLINVTEGHECRIALLEEGILEELYTERADMNNMVGNIYKGTVVNIEPGIQAAFVDFGVGRNGFLHISDLHPRYFKTSACNVEHVGRRKPLKDRPPIQRCLSKGQQIVVQVIKEGLKGKGPTVSAYIAIAGKYLVLVPWMKKCGVSHKIEEPEERARLLEMLRECRPPENQGFIIRTAGRNCTKRELRNDLKYLNRVWTAVAKRVESAAAPAELYQESDLVIRVLRDVYDSRVISIICDSAEMVKQIKDFLAIAAPRIKCEIRHYDRRVPLFHEYAIEEQIARVRARSVRLPGGSYLVIERTEALVSVDVNSGRYRREKTAEETAYKTNLQAAPEIARQLRLRDLGGLIICDFIDMRNPKHRKAVERVFKAAFKGDRAHHEILNISRFGVVEMTRQRLRSSDQEGNFLACRHCGGSGYVRDYGSLSAEVMRVLFASASDRQVRRIEVAACPDFAAYLQNERRSVIGGIEEADDTKISIVFNSDYAGEQYDIVCYDSHGKIVKV